MPSNRLDSVSANDAIWPSFRIVQCTVLGQVMICYLFEPTMLCSSQEIIEIDNHASIRGMGTNVKKVKKDLSVGGVRQRLERQNLNKGDNSSDPKVIMLLQFTRSMSKKERS